MRWLSLPTLLVCVALVGCQNNNADRAVLYQEIRELEDEVYTLEDMLDQYESKLASSRRANQALRREASGGGNSGDPSRSSIPQTFQPPQIDFVPPSSPDTDAPAYVPSRESLPEPPKTQPLDAPNFEMPAPDVDPLNDPQVRPSAYYELYPEEGGSGGGAGRLLQRRLQKEEEITDYIVDHITLNRQLTGAHNSDRHPGDEGVYIVVEPRNKADQVIDVPGKLTIVVTDPGQRGPEGRIARWDYSMEESADSFRQSIFGRGMHLELPWPGEPPQSEELDLYVRYITDDGRRLIAEKKVRADPLPTHDYAEHRQPPCETCDDSEVASGETSQVAGTSQDSWRRRTRSFRSLIPASSGEARTASLDTLLDPEPVITIPTTAGTSNFDAPAEVNLSPSATQTETQAARMLPTTADPANDGTEQVRYEFAPREQSEPRPREQPEKAPPAKTARKRVEWSPNR